MTGQVLSCGNCCQHSKVDCGDWFDVCRCNIPCPCEFAQAPTYDDCDGIMAYNIKKGSYGETPLAGLNVLILTSFKGINWAYDTPGKRVQTINPPGSEVGPGGVATWGKSLADEVDAMGFKRERKGKSSKHIPFSWSGP
jgi:hypothetical protein